ncbi:30S ribosomal protein S8e [Methanoplanus sp. FWC-SCC4]|uniref:Small ribosomal subunit protein eS8 n=1 Tax=Methanochimaera problematica TaxID=2609417 RepID=A0AA97F9W6_9EURY|nr:30S ribosomal protein S8e [Methanoplanus sp. FWC-SCC4]WOF15530.1 30S ribosomal protein S8e [Methanoplanus sp. FWC-SCC4]
MLWQGRSVRRQTGGRIKPACGKRRVDIGRSPAETHIGEARRKLIRTHGGNQKVRAMRDNFACVSNPKTGETKKVEIKNVEVNPANPNYVRRNLLTKGAIILTEAGKARIVSRPGQDGVINAVLIE